MRSKNVVSHNKSALLLVISLIGSLLLFSQQAQAADTSIKVRTHSTFWDDFLSVNLPAVIGKFSQKHDSFVGVMDGLKIEEAKFIAYQESEQKTGSDAIKTHVKFTKASQTKFEVTVDNFDLKGQVVAGVVGTKPLHTGTIEMTSQVKEIKLQFEISPQKITEHLTRDVIRCTKADFVLSKASAPTVRSEGQVGKFTGSIKTTASKWFDQMTASFKAEFKDELNKHISQFDSWCEQNRENLFNYSPKKSAQPDELVLSQTLRIKDSYLICDLKGSYQDYKADQRLFKDISRAPKQTDFADFGKKTGKGQIVIDEQTVNEYLFRNFHLEKSHISMNQIVLDLTYLGLGEAIYHSETYAMLQEHIEFLDVAIAYVMEKVTAATEEATKHSDSPVDFRCSFSEDFSKNSVKGAQSLNQVKLHEGNRVEYTGTFGCALLTYQGNGKGFEFREGKIDYLRDDGSIITLGEDSKEDEGDEGKSIDVDLDDLFGDDDDSSSGSPKSVGDWHVKRGIFFEFGGNMTFDFNNDQRGSLSAYRSVMKDFTLDILAQRKICEGEMIVGIRYDDAPSPDIGYCEEYDFDWIMHIEPLEWLMQQKDTYWDVFRIGQSLLQYTGRFSPMMQINKCMGVKALGSSIEINDGHIVVDFDPIAKKAANPECYEKLETLGRSKVRQDKLINKVRKIIQNERVEETSIKNKYFGMNEYAPKDGEDSWNTHITPDKHDCIRQLRWGGMTVECEYFLVRKVPYSKQPSDGQILKHNLDKSEAIYPKGDPMHCRQFVDGMNILENVCKDKDKKKKKVAAYMVLDGDDQNDDKTKKTDL